VSGTEALLAPEAARDGWVWLAVALLRLAVVAAAVAVVVYPLVPPQHFWARESWGDYLYLLRGHQTSVPLNLLWGMEGFRRLGEEGCGLLAGLLLALAFVPWPDAEGRPRPGLKINTGVLLAGVAVSTPVVCYLLRVDYGRNATFGDSVWLPLGVDVDDVAAAEVLTSHLFILLRQLFDLFRPGPNGVAAVCAASCLGGGLFAAALFLFADAVGVNRLEKVFLFLGGLGAGYTAMFLGYVETTQIGLAGAALFLACAARAFRAERTPARLVCTAVALAAASFAFLAHGGAILLVPAVVYLLGCARAGLGDRQRQLCRVLPLCAVLLFVGLVVLPYYLFVAKPFFLAGDFGNLRGGGDGIMLVPRNITYGLPKSPYVYYTVWSTAHGGEIASAYLMAAPLSLPLLAAGAVFWSRRRRLVAGRERRLVALLILAGAGCAAIPLLWNHDFGMWGDWNIAASYLFPWNLLAWTWFVVTSRGFFREGRGRLRLMSSLLAAQLVMAGGIALQFY